jgi:hypothetical protein
MCQIQQEQFLPRLITSMFHKNRKIEPFYFYIFPRWRRLPGYPRQRRYRVTVGLVNKPLMIPVHSPPDLPDGLFEDFISPILTLHLNWISSLLPGIDCSRQDDRIIVIDQVQEICVRIRCRKDKLSGYSFILLDFAGKNERVLNPILTIILFFIE